MGLAERLRGFNHGSLLQNKDRSSVSGGVPGTNRKHSQIVDVAGPEPESQASKLLVGMLLLSLVDDALALLAIFGASCMGTGDSDLMASFCSAIHVDIGLVRHFFPLL